MEQQIPKVYAHEVLTTRQGTAMPETALCGHHFTAALIRKATDNALTSEDWDGNEGFIRAFDNPELHCIECGA
ncbi:MAG: hypothetical protein M1522_08535 [Actinobacteria bacterium]|nr:hypothetical protein [Actinomycetota bacterium]